MEDQKNFALAMALSVLLLVVYYMFFAGPQIEAAQEQAAIEAQIAESGYESPEVPVATPAASVRIPIDTSSVEGSFELRGFRFDDIKLRDYDATLEEDSLPVTLLTPGEAAGDYSAYMQDNWAVVDGGKGVDTDWQLVSGDTLTDSTPIQLRYEGEGFTVDRTVAASDRFLFTVSDRVTNTSGANIDLVRHGLSRQIGLPEDLTNFFILHEGPISVVDDRLFDMKYGKIEKELREARTGDAGWVGLTDKYWLAAAIAPQGATGTANMTAEFEYLELNGAPVYDASYETTPLVLTPGTTVESRGYLFTGAKERDLLERLESDYDIPELNRAIDWGTLRILVKPMTTGLNWLGQTLGNYGVAIIVFTLIIKLLLFPLFNKQYRSMARMKKVAPELKRMRERYSDENGQLTPENRLALQQEMMKLYKTEGVNPLSGCLPIIPTIFIFFALYKTVLIDTELRHAPFMGYIQDLSARESVNILNLFGILPFEAPTTGIIAFLAIGPLALLYGATFSMMQTLQTPQGDPMQRKIFMALPWVFMFILAPFAAGLLLYWVANNVFSFLQSYIIYKRMGVDIPLEEWIATKLGRRKALPDGVDVIPPEKE